MHVIFHWGNEKNRSFHLIPKKLHFDGWIQKWSGHTPLNNRYGIRNDTLPDINCVPLPSSHTYLVHFLLESLEDFVALRQGVLKFLKLLGVHGQLDRERWKIEKYCYHCNEQICDLCDHEQHTVKWNTATKKEGLFALSRVLKCGRSDFYIFLLLAMSANEKQSSIHAYEGLSKRSWNHPKVKALENVQTWYDLYIGGFYT